MSTTLGIQVLSGPRKGERYVFGLGGRFMDKIVFGQCTAEDGMYFKPDLFLSWDEQKVFEPDYWDPGTRGTVGSVEVTPRDPKALKSVLVKLYEHFRANGPLLLNMFERDLTAAISVCETAIENGAMVEWSVTY
jgi:hypothetical protein